MSADPFIIGDIELKSRLLIGTGKFSSPELLSKTLAASEADIITVALRRVNFDNPEDEVMQHIDTAKYTLMPNTSGARNAEEAIRLARLARAASGSDWIKLELTPEPNHLLPDPIETLKTAEVLVAEGFTVLPYINISILAKRLEAIGVAAVMPLAAPIGTNRGIESTEQLQIIIDNSNIPVIIDAGIGAPSHACQAMEMGADAVLLNTAIATATDPIAMARAFKDAIIAGRTAYLAGLPASQAQASSSSPLTGFLHT